MDLVEIRKKAGNKRQKAKELPPPESTEPTAKSAAPKTEPAPVPPVAAPEVVEAAQVPVATAPAVPAKAKTSRAKKAVADDIDPIEALFSFRVEGDLATEETYLQALMGKEEVVDSQQRQWLTFSLGEEEYALDIESITEIIKPREVTDIPRVPAFIRGIISLRGIIVPIFDLKGRLKLGTVEEKSSARIIVCQKDERIAGFLVDAINQVVNIPLSRIEPPPTVLSGVDRDFVEGVGRVEGRMLILLHLSHVINAELVN